MALDCEPGPGGFRFIWKPAQSNCLPTQPPHSYALPLYLTVGKMGFRQTGQSKAGGTPAMSRAGSLRMRFLGSGWIPTDFAGKRAPGAGGCPFSSRLSAPGKRVSPLHAAPLAPPCRRVKDARQRPAHGCVVRGVVLFFVPPVEFTRSGAWGPCFWGKQGVFQPNRVRKVENMTLFFGAGLLYTTRGWGLRPGGVLLVH